MTAFFFFDYQAPPFARILYVNLGAAHYDFRIKTPVIYFIIWGTNV